MNIDMKKIMFAVLVGYTFGTTMPALCAEKTQTTQKIWSTWVKVGAAASVVASVCVWYYMDIRLQNVLATSVHGAQKQFVENLKYHAAYNIDGTPRIISAETSYSMASEAEILSNTTASLKLLCTDFKAELLFYHIGSKLCALAAALGFYGLMKPAPFTQKEKQKEQPSTAEQA